MKNNYLYRRNNNGKPYVWYAYFESNDNRISIHHGIVGMNIRIEHYKPITKDAIKELASKYNEKIKLGYKPLSEICDDHDLPPVEDINSLELYNYLNTYLPTNLVNGNNNNLLPMLAKTYTGNVWKKESIMFGQYKINGLRCIITPYAQNDLFKPYRLRFQSREGIVWNSLNSLENYLLSVISTDSIKIMIDNNYSLDGELYFPCFNINDINHFVKDNNCAQNALLQYWCYDIMAQDMLQYNRDIIRYTLLANIKNFTNIKDHLNNKNQLINLFTYEITNDEQALEHRNKFINLGFEGLILRNPNVEYQFGRRRVGFMEKYKDTKEGNFIIVRMIKENKRDLPIIICRNDINDELFETRFSCPHEQQKEYLYNKEKYIGKYVYIQYGERSGINRLPFHIKEVKLIN